MCWGAAAMLRRQSTIKHNQPMWYDTMLDAVKHTIIISEILDTRTRHLVQVALPPVYVHFLHSTSVVAHGECLRSIPRASLPALQFCMQKTLQGKIIREVLHPQLTTATPVHATLFAEKASL